PAKPTKATSAKKVLIASPCPKPAWLAGVRVRLWARAPMPIARRFILSVSSVNPSPATVHPEKRSALDRGTEHGGALRKDEISLPEGGAGRSVHEWFTISPARRQQSHRRVASVPLWNRPSGRSRRHAPGASPTFDRLAASSLPVPIRPPSA